MIFNSPEFLLFFVLFFICYWGINNRFSVRFRNLFILAGSYIFYGWWDWRFLGLILLSSALDYTIGLLLNAPRRVNRKFLLWISIAVNLGILGAFKYYDFFIHSFQSAMEMAGIHLNISTLQIVLPVGISFYTFQTLSYTIDIYRNKIQPTKDLIAFFTFVAFFPQLVAGPIERASNLLHQFSTRKIFTYSSGVEGMRLVLWGFFKKIVIADNFGVLADMAFDVNASVNGLTVIMGSIFFGIQIYGDFSGYSDIAIGLSRMLGFKLMRNFTTPYFAGSFTDFWKRWHISLSSWFRDYVYIPLGGNQHGVLHMHFNLLITFLLSGLWHGANFTFLLWGALHGLALSFEKIIRSRRTMAPGILVVLPVVLLLWIPFRAENLTHLMVMLKAISDGAAYSFLEITEFINQFSPTRFLILLGLWLCWLGAEWKIGRSDFNEWIQTFAQPIRVTVYYLLLLGILLAGNFTVKPDFIYFQF